MTFKDSTDGFRDIPLALVVDDDTAARLMISAALVKNGLEVIQADSGAGGVRLFREKMPDIVLLDVLMPDMDGFAVCEKIRNLADGQFTQILMVTGLDDSDSAELAFDKGANGFVTKPLNLTMLGQRVNYMLRAGAAFRELHNSRNRLAKTQELAQIGNWQIDLLSGAFNCSAEACNLLKLDGMEKPIGMNRFLSSVIPEDKAQVLDRLNQAVQNHEAVSCHYRIRCPDGAVKHILNKAEIIFDDFSRPSQMLGIVQDITQLKIAEDEIRFLAFSDSLTGLANRLLFMDRLDQAIRDAARKEKHFALLFLDLDHFKHVNDTLGHHVGDLLLKKVAATIQQSIRKSDSAIRISGEDTTTGSLIARLGGDEFTVLVTDLEDPGYAALVAKRILDAIPETHLLDGNEVSICTSIGISIFPDDGDDGAVLLKNADAAMYAAKRKGRNGFRFYRQSMNAAARERFTMETDLKQAVSDRRFFLLYQPKVCLADGRITGVEALIRWDHPTRGVLPPEQFIPVAAKSDAIIHINQWVLETACHQATVWADQDIGPLRMSINLSGDRLDDQDMIRTLDSILEKTGFDPEYLDVEITEDLLLRNRDRTIRILDEIRARRLKIALDDFGTGYSSLSLLSTFPVDVIKIDRSFILGDDNRKRNTPVVKAMIAMGHSLGKEVVAEGVETEAQFQWLRGMGCDEGQGHFFSRPMDAASVSGVLAGRYF